MESIEKLDDLKQNQSPSEIAKDPMKNVDPLLASGKGPISMDEIKRTFKAIYDHSRGVTIGPPLTPEYKTQLLLLLEFVRCEEGATQEATSRAIGVTPETYCRWVTGEIKPGRMNIYKILRFLAPKFAV